MYGFFTIFLPCVWAQGDPTTTGPSSSAQGLVVGIRTAPFPTATGPRCLEPRGPNDPPASEIDLAFSADDPVSKACNTKNQNTNTIGQLFVISYSYHVYFFNISHNVNVVSAAIARPNQCPDAFNSILDQCVTGAGKFWGGYTQGGIANYSIANHLYPESPLVQPELPGPTTTSAAPAATTTELEPMDTPMGTTSVPIPLEILEHPLDTNSQGTAGRTTRNVVDSPIFTDDPTTSFDQDAMKTITTSGAARESLMSLQPGDTIVTSTISGFTVVETFIPTTFSQYVSISTATSIASINSQNGAFTYVVGPGGVGWSPLSRPTAGPQIQPNDVPFQSVIVKTINTAIGISTSEVAPHASTLPKDFATKTITDPVTTGIVLPVITTAFDIQAATLTSLDPAITGNTAISTGDSGHPLGPMPNIVVNDELVPSAKEEADDRGEDEDGEPSNTRPKKTQPTKTQTSERSIDSCTASTGLGRGAIIFQDDGGTTTGISRTSTAVASTGANPATGNPGTLATTQGVRTTNTNPDTLITSRRAGSSTAQTVPAAVSLSTSKYVPPAWQCPNDGVRQNAPGCPTPTTSTGDHLRCSTGSNIGAVTFNHATWCGCNRRVYPTISGATADYYAYQTVPSSTIKPTQVPNPYPFTTTNMQNGEVVACATSSIDAWKSSTACQGSSTVVSTVDSIAEAASSSAAAAIPTENCDFFDEVLFWHFEVYNINGCAGEGGSSLKAQEKGCGGLTGWEWGVDDNRYQHASFNLPFTMKEGCVERAIKSAGGPGGLSCKGHGLKKRSVQDPGNKAHKNLRPKRYGKRSEHLFTHQYLDEKLTGGGSVNISSQSLVSRAHIDAWNKYAPKGIQYYNEWKNRPADQDDKAALSASAIFWNNISPVDNVIIAFSNDRGGDAEESEDPSPDNWSDMLWWLWLRATAEGGNESALSQIFMYNVDNEASKEILEEILGDKQDEVVTLEPDEAQSHDNGFWALLGCPNGMGMVHLVGDHKKALNGKGH
ncbi:MAG: hypothetical protein Q9213_005414 [Squamulea squamosa]